MTALATGLKAKGSRFPTANGASTDGPSGLPRVIPTAHEAVGRFHNRRWTVIAFRLDGAAVEEET